MYQFSDGRGQVRRERSVDVRLEGGQVDLDQLVVAAARVGRQQGLKNKM